MIETGLKAFVDGNLGIAQWIVNPEERLIVPTTDLFENFVNGWMQEK